MAFVNRESFPADQLTTTEVVWVQTGSAGVALLKETTAPSATTGYGKIYVKSSDHLLYWKDASGTERVIAAGSGVGTVTSVSVVSANGFDGTVANPGTTPAITISTTITGILKGNGSAISAATAGTDYLSSVNASSPLSGAGTSGSPLIFTNPGYITGVVADSPLSGAGTSVSHLSIPKATGSVDGYLAQGDFSTFAGKLTSPMTTLGDIIYENVTPVADRLAGNTTNTVKYLQSVGAGGVAQAPSWQQINYSDLTGTFPGLTSVNGFV